jgi:hypothetical protein
MDIDERLAKVKVEVESNRKDVDRLDRTLDALRASVERGFAEQRAATDRQFAELRKEMNANFRWLYGLVFTNLTFTFGIIVHMAGVI